MRLFSKKSVCPAYFFIEKKGENHFAFYGIYAHGVTGPKIVRRFSHIKEGVNSIFNEFGVGLFEYNRISFRTIPDIRFVDGMIDDLPIKGVSVSEHLNNPPYTNEAYSKIF